MTKRTVRLIDLIFNFAIFASTVWAVGFYFFGGPDVPGGTGTQCFVYFTTDSNVLCGLAAGVVCVLRVMQLVRPETEMPAWVTLLRFTGTVSVALTLLTVVFFLAPVSCVNAGIGSVPAYFAGNIFCLHLSTPVLAIVSLIFFDREGKVGLVRSLFGLIPTVVYSVVYLILVVFVKVWYDWYGFTFGGHYALAPVAMLAMYAVTFGIGVVLYKLRRTKLKD